MISECNSNLFFSYYMRLTINSLKCCAKLRVPLPLALQGVAFYPHDVFMCFVYASQRHRFFSYKILASWCLQLRITVFCMMSNE